MMRLPHYFTLQTASWKPNLRVLAMAGLLVSIIGSVAGTAAELPQYDSEVHLGVASCASGVCHGSVRPRSSSNVLQTEYVVWSRRDRHRIAYQTLLTPESQRIAANLGLKNAHEAKVCLDCHADNVAAEQQGEKFLMSDGVGCEACHGGAGDYIAGHADSSTSRQDNIDAGLYPTDNAASRAILCLSCHLGTDDKLANHNIMGAGHPRLAFELDTFGILQPAHYVLDEDYKAAKWYGDSLTTWIIGQTRSADQALSLIATRLDNGGLFPELALFDCQACHHPMSKPRWVSNETGLPPGSVRLNDANFIMLFALAKVIAPDVEVSLRQQVAALHQAVAARQPLADLIEKLRSDISSIEKIAGRETSATLPEQLLRVIAQAGSEDQFADYVAAEQATMAIDMLLSAANLRSEFAGWLEQLYSRVSDEDNYSPDEMMATLTELKKTLSVR
jgi:hypothetical protein